MSKETGGPAFPCVVETNGSGVKGHEIFGDLPPNKTSYFPGASLRDYFAAKVMQGDWASQNESMGGFTNDVSEETLYDRARVYYRMAEAMLLARGE